jgi:hypothetical protein
VCQNISSSQQGFPKMGANDKLKKTYNIPIKIRMTKIEGYQEHKNCINK